MSGDIQARVEAILAAHIAVYSTGFARCSCGWETDVLPTGRERTVAHRAHVAAAIAADLADVAGADGLREALAEAARAVVETAWTASDCSIRLDLRDQAAYMAGANDGVEFAARLLRERAALAAQPAPADDEGGAR